MEGGLGSVHYLSVPLPCKKGGGVFENFDPKKGGVFENFDAKKGGVFENFDANFDYVSK